VDSIPEIVSDLEFGRSKLLQAIEGLSQRELTQVPVYQDWTIKDVLAHVIGWDQRVLKTLPLMLQNRASEVASVEVDAYNQESVAAWRDKPWVEVLATAKSIHRQVLDIIVSLDHKEIDLRRERHGRTITIRSYVIDIMTEHDREHAAEIEQWRKSLEQQLDPVAIKAELVELRTQFLALVVGVNPAAASQKNVLGQWSIKDVVGHVVDWEWLMLKAARHIYDPSLPVVGPVSDDWNEMMVAKRGPNSWQHELKALTEVQQAVEMFIAQLKPGDWALRGPYPWPDDRGSLAELISHISGHYADHLPELAQWQKQQLD
jgi:uncharacterized damage-inducible protein DinB